jgi:hypothetical protein
MKLCMLGCGCVVHDVEQHVKAMHPEADFPDQPESHWSDKDWDSSEWTRIQQARYTFLLDNFRAITL